MSYDTFELISVLAALLIGASVTCIILAMTCIILALVDRFIK